MASTAKLEKATLRYALVNATTEGGENTVIAAVEGRSIVVLGYALSFIKPGAYTLKDSSASRAKLQVPENGGATYSGGAKAPAFECAQGKALVLETIASSKGFGHITYVLI